MELRQLEYFVSVAEEANFTRAAAKVHVSQPGLSAQIRRLEDELGQALFDRTARKVRLTKAGAAMLPHARAALETVGLARSAVHGMEGQVQGRVAMGTVVACGALDVPRLLAGFRRRYPGVEIALSEAPSDELVRTLEEKRLDLALIGVFGSRPPGLGGHILVDEALVAAVGLHDPWASRSQVSLRKLHERELISLPPGTGLRACLDAACAEAGVRPRIAFEGSNLNLLAELAALHMGVAILPHSLAQARAQTLRSLAIARPSLRSRMEVVWRQELPGAPAARAFVEYVRTALAR